MSPTSFVDRFRSALSEEPPHDGAPWIVAVSGGLDSVVLLHLLRHAVRFDEGLVVAHFDHGMRPESRDDARWVMGLAAAWGLPVRSLRADRAPSSEASAREARYAFLEQVRHDAGARLVLTAHHADDQAESVLFRALRGSGGAGLAGIPARRGPLFRPLLPFWREEIEVYAQEARITYREDSTNTSLTYARNALRHRVLPDIETLVAPGARRALVRLAGVASQQESAWESVLPGLLEPLGVDEGEGIVSIDQAGIAALHPAVQARVLRHLVSRLGRVMDAAATKRATDLIVGGASGSSVDLGAGYTLRRELDRVAISGPTALPPDRPVQISDVGPGFADALLSGRLVSVRWGGGVDLQGYTSAGFDPDRLRFPLFVRGRRDGDRIQLPGGTKKVKKFLLERRVPGTARGQVPLLLDALGEVLWIPGFARATGAGGRGGPLTIGIG